LQLPLKVLDFLYIKGGKDSEVGSDSASKITTFFNKLYLIKKLSVISPDRRNNRKELLLSEHSTLRRGASRLISSMAIQLIGFMAYKHASLPA
jgi:hypothetical protein